MKLKLRAKKIPERMIMMYAIPDRGGTGDDFIIISTYLKNEPQTTLPPDARILIDMSLETWFLMNSPIKIFGKFINHNKLQIISKGN